MSTDNQKKLYCKIEYVLYRTTNILLEYVFRG
jgi:hypothetical protein